jgi:adhesin transport system outer membrane protein
VNADRRCHGRQHSSAHTDAATRSAGSVWAGLWVCAGAALCAVPARAVAAGAADTLGMTDAVQQAVTRHPSIAAAAAAMAQADAQVDVMRAGRSPQVAASLSGQRQLGQSLALVPTVTASQLLHDFGKLDSRVTQAEHLARQQAALLLKQVDQVAQQTAEAFVATHRYQEMREAAQGHVAAIERIHAIASLRFRAGATSSSDPVQTGARLMGAKSQLLQMESQLRQAREHLRSLVGQPAPARVDGMSDTLQAGLREAADAQHLLLPDLLAARASLAAARAAADQARLQNRPTVSLEASGSHALRGTNPSALSGQRNAVSLGLMLQAPLYQGGLQDSNQRAAQAAVAAAEAQVATAELLAQDSANVLLEQILNASQRSQNTEEQLQLTTRTRELYQEQYKLGSRTVLDLLNTEADIFAIRSDGISARHDRWQAIVAFLVATGQSRTTWALDQAQVRHAQEAAHLD